MDLMLIDLLESSKAIGLCPMGKIFDAECIWALPVQWVYKYDFM